jgi:hypothetical protein
MDARELLSAERETEKRFVSAAQAMETSPTGWPAALNMFHIAQWRGRLRSALSDDRAGRQHAPFTGNVDELNDAELPKGAAVPLAEAAAHADEELAQLIDLAAQDGPFKWGPTGTVAEAVIRNSYIHPRNHMAAYLRENGDGPAADRMLEEAATALRDAAAPPFCLGAALYNLAIVRVGQGRDPEALELLEEAAPMRPDLATAAAQDSELARLRGEPRFQAVVRSGAAQA